jgi:type IV pilus assembly protein PilP
MNEHYYIHAIKIIPFILLTWIIMFVSPCMAESTGISSGVEQEDANIGTLENIETAPEDANMSIKNFEDPNSEDLKDTEIENSEAVLKQPQDNMAISTRNPDDMALKDDEYHYDPFGKRDPFYSKLFYSDLSDEKNTGEDETKKLGVQRYDLTELNLVGIIWGELGRKAVVETPEGKCYLINAGMLIGKQNGVIKAITNQEVVIQELVTDYLGKQVEKISVLKIQHKEQEQ